MAEQKSCYDYKKDEWICSESLPKNYIISEIEKEFHFTKDASSILLKEFIGNNLLEYHITKDDIIIGSILSTFWNIVSDNDLNFHKYIKQYGKKTESETLQEEIVKYKSNDN